MFALVNPAARLPLIGNAVAKYIDGLMNLLGSMVLINLFLRIFHLITTVSQNTLKINLLQYKQNEIIIIKNVQENKNTY